MSLTLKIAVLIILVLINAFFAMSEMAVISANKTKLEIFAKDGNKKALMVQKLQDNQTNFLSTIQVGITLASKYVGIVPFTKLTYVILIVPLDSLILSLLTILSLKLINPPGEYILKSNL